MRNALSYLLIFLFSICQTTIKSQCSVSDFFPVEFGITKFKATTSIAQKNNTVNKYTIRNQMAQYWNTFDYLDGDSVYTSGVRYVIKKDLCFDGYDNTLTIMFCDDHLYSQRISLLYTDNSFNKCLNRYKSIVSIFKTIYPFTEDYVRANNQTNEQIGESIKFFKSSPEYEDVYKPNYVEVGYSYSYKFNEDSFGNIERVVNGYNLEIKHLNLQGTKLSSKGF